MPRIKLLALTIAQLAGLSTAQAASISVTSAADTQSNGDGCSLREAVINANANDQSGSTDCEAGSGDDIISLPTDTTISLLSALPDLTSNIQVLGNGARVERSGACTINGTADAGEFRLFNAAEVNQVVGFSNVTLAGGCADGSGPSGYGGAVRLLNNSATFDSVSFLNNQAYVGGAIATGAESSAALLIRQSNFVGNNAYKGGALNGDGLNINIESSTFSTNTAGFSGGAINFRGLDSSETLGMTNSTVSNNSAFYGGGLYLDGAATLSGSTVSGNSASILGGGIQHRKALSLNSVVVSGNTADNYGGGIASDSANAVLTITGSQIESNTSTGAGGGGIALTAMASASLTDSLIGENQALKGMGIFVSSNSTLSALNTTLFGNQQLNSGSNNRPGGGIYTSGQTTLRFSTVTENRASDGGGVQVASGGSLTLDHSIVADNQDFIRSGAEPSVRNEIFDVAYAGSVSATFSLIGDNRGTTLSAAPVGSADGYGNLIGASGSTIAPLLSGLITTPNGLRAAIPQAGSPAIDAGQASPSSAPANDTRGSLFSRIANGFADMGAVEVQSLGLGTLMVDTLTDELDTDTSPGDLSLREAITLVNNSSDDDTIIFSSSITGTGSTLTFSLGEFAITDDLTLTGPGATQLTLDANHASRHFTIGLNNSGLSALAPLVSFSGLRLINGNAGSDEGGAIFSNTTLNLSDMTIAGNTARLGGALRQSTSKTLTLSNSTLSGNSATESGGALDLDGTVQLSDVLIEDNTATNHGGGLYFSGDELSIDRTTIRGNSATNQGGGLYLDGEFTATDCTLSDNAANNGGGLYSSNTVSLTRCTISGNSVGGAGGGVYITGNELTLADSTVSGNTAQFGAGVYVASAITSIRRSSLVGNTATGSGAQAVGGLYCADSLSIQSSILAANIGAYADFNKGGSIAPPTLNSLIGDNAGSGLAEAQTPDSNGNLIGSAAGAGIIDPQLGALADNGGLTETRLPQLGSPVIDAFSGCTGNDQRGETRGSNGNGATSATECDIGAVEYQFTALTAQDESGSANQNGGVQAQPNVLANEVDPADDYTASFSVTAVDGQPAKVGVNYTIGGGVVKIATNGAATYNTGNAFRYLDDGESADVAIDYTVSDGLSSDTATLTITVAGANDAPFTENSSGSTTEDIQVMVDLIAGDQDGDALNASLVSAPTKGTVAFDNPNLKAIFSPNGEFEALDDGESEQVSFTYKVNDGDVDSSGSSLVKVTVNGVNDTPVAQNAAASTGQQSAVIVDLPASDVDGDALTAVLVNAPSKGSVSVDSANLKATFDPNGAFDALDDGESEVVSFDYKVNDGDVDSASNATVSITVNGINDAPTADGTTASTSEDSAVQIPLPAADLDGDSLNAALVSAAAKGVVSFDNPNLIASFDPNGAFEALDDGESEQVTFTYQVNDGDLDSATSASVVVTINGANDAPLGTNDSYSANPGQTLTVDAASGLLANDSDVDDEPLSVTAGTFTPSGIGGSLKIQADGSFSYTAPNAAGTASYTYTISDGDAQSTATVSFSVGLPTSALSITKTDGVSLIAPLDVLTYTITVSNAGPSNANAVRVQDMLPMELGNASWSCEAIMPGPATACGNASGSGNIDELVNIAAGDAVVFELMTTLNEGVNQGQISNTATVAVPADREDPNLSDNSATDVDQLTRVFSSGFEDTVVPLTFAKRSASLTVADIESRLPQDVGYRPTLVAKATSPTDSGFALIHARRSGAAIQIRLSRFEQGVWMMGRWQVLKTDRAQLIW